MKTALRLAALATILTLAPAAFADTDSSLGELLEAPVIGTDPAMFEQAAATSAAVPEPAALAPIAGAIIVALRRRRVA